MKNSKQKKPFLLYTIIIILALVILALGGLTLYSFQDLASLRSKVTDLQNTVQEISDTSAELISKAKELGSLNDQLESQMILKQIPPLILHRMYRKKGLFLLPILLSLPLTKV